MLIEEKNKRNLQTFELPLMVVLSVVLIFASLLFASIDSPFYEMWGRNDSSWFFTAGKAWMHGMIPYVDFTDSKGPLLWLIYGVGYRISNYDFVGVWFLTCINYLVTFWLVFGVARIFLKSRWWSFLVAVMMIHVFFSPHLHYETRAEDFCQPYITLGLLVACRVLYGSHTHDLRSSSLYYNSAWLIGISMGATLMIKFTLAIMVSFFAIMICIDAYRSRSIKIFDLVWRVLAGTFLVCLPFVVVFIYLGNLDDFVREYFIFTSKISSHPPRLNIIGWVIRGGFLSHLIIIMCISTSSFLFMRKKYKYTWMPLAAFWWFLMITVQNAEWKYYYYSCLIFGLFGLVVLTRMASYIFTTKLSIAIVSVLIMFGLVFYSYKYSIGIYSFKYVEHNDAELEDLKKEYYHHVDILGKVDTPRVVFFNCNHLVNAIDEVGGIPGCKYWSRQYGAYNMKYIQFCQIKRNKPHFVYVRDKDNMNKILMEYLGYFCVNPAGKVCNLCVYAHPKLKALY